MSDSAIRIMCPNLRCKAVLAVPAEARGRMVRCRACSANIQVPLKKEPIPISEPESEESGTAQEKA